MKTRWKISILAGILFAWLAVSVFFSARFQPQNAVEAYKQSLRERGEKLELGEILPPPVAPESNSVQAVEDAFGLMGSGSVKIPDAMIMVAPGKAKAGWAQPAARGYDFTNSWEDFAAEAAADQPAIEQLRQVLERPVLEFQLDYKKGATMLLPHLAPMKRVAQRLEAGAVCDLHFGDSGPAATNILILLGLVQKNASEGLLISHLVRIAITAVAVTPTWELLQATNLTDAPLAAVQNGWEQLDFLSDAENAFVMERVWGLAEIERMRATHYEFGKMFGAASLLSSSGGSSSAWNWPPDWEAITKMPRYAVGEFMWRSSWSYADELRTLKSDSIILETLRTMQTNRSRFYGADFAVMKTRLSSLGITNAGAAFFRALKIPDLTDIFGDGGLSSAVQKTLRIEAARDLVVTAIALKRYQMQHGHLPEKLNDLTPAFLRVVPIDPFDGKPLRYNPNADGTYLLYSVGEDGKDDGGDPTNTASGSSSLNWQNPRARDWVWPQPATAAEIKYFYEHPPK